MLQPSRHRRLRPFILVVALALSSALASPARADEFNDRVNAPFKAIPEKLRSDLVLLPKLGAMDPVPAVYATQARAAQLGSKGPGWADAAAWAQKPNQTAVLTALDEITKEEDRLKAFAFAQPYGVEGVSVDLVAKGLYTELGDPPLLAAARHLYLPALENAGVLCQIEASRRHEAGDLPGALKVLGDWLFFCRQMADRPTVREKKWALESMKLTLERMRDVVYLDQISGKPTIDAAGLRKVNDRLKERRGFLQIDRIDFPEADFVAREQLLSKVMVPNSGPSETTFGTTMARVSASERPLKLFSAAAFWESARAAHAGQRESSKMLAGIHDDWRRRWQLSPFDRYVNTATDYRKLVQTTTKFSVLSGAFDDVDAIFQLRREIRAELGATRLAIGVYAFSRRQQSLPRSIAAIRPEFVDAIDKDPYSSRGNDLQFFVPLRDTRKGPNGEDRPHTITLFPPAPQPQFALDLIADTFVIYSVGPDDAAGQAVTCTQTRVGVPGDYLLYPPTLSLFRQRLIESNELK